MNTSQDDGQIAFGVLLSICDREDIVRRPVVDLSTPIAALGSACPNDVADPNLNTARQSIRQQHHRSALPSHTFHANERRGEYISTAR